MLERHITFQSFHFKNTCPSTYTKSTNCDKFQSFPVKRQCRPIALRLYPNAIRSYNLAHLFHQTKLPFLQTKFLSKQTSPLHHQITFPFKQFEPQHLNLLHHKQLWISKFKIAKSIFCFTLDTT